MRASFRRPVLDTITEPRRRKQNIAIISRRVQNTRRGNRDKQESATKRPKQSEQGMSSTHDYYDYDYDYYY